MTSQPNAGIGPWIERRARAAPDGVALIADAGVAAVSESGGEQVAKAFVVMAAGIRTTEPELLAWCREYLAPHQVPAFVTFVDRLLRNSVGKLMRAELHNAATPHA
jgi:acyl-coenzyme A synthetase/AMP-(fatty) acid ligase